MPSDLRLYYWDANVWIHYFQATPEHITVLDEMLHRASTGMGLAIVTSTVTIAEVAHGGMKVPDEQVQVVFDRIDRMWRNESVVRLVEASELVMYDARDLIREGRRRGWEGLRSIDAIHLATARRMKVKEFHTYEKETKLAKYGPLCGFEVRKPWLEQPPLDGMSAASPA